MKTILGLSPFIMVAIGYPIVVSLRLKPFIKKRVIRIFAISWGIYFLCAGIIPTLKEKDLPVLVFVVPVISLMVFAMIKYTKVCPECRHTDEFTSHYVEPKVCPKCGSEYDINDL